MSPLTRGVSSEARQYGEPSSVPSPIVKSATSRFPRMARHSAVDPPMVFSEFS